MAFEFLFNPGVQIIALIINLIAFTVLVFSSDNANGYLIILFLSIWGIIGVCISGLIYYIFQVPMNTTLLSYNLITTILFILILIWGIKDFIFDFVGSIIDFVWEIISGKQKKAKELQKLQDTENLNRKIEFEKREVIEREEEKKRKAIAAKAQEEEEKRLREMLEEEWKRKTVEREQFVQKQTAQGLVAFTDRNGEELWETPDEIEKIKRIEEDELIKESLLFKVTNSIEEFEPTKDWGNENNYHIELLGWLKREFPDIVEYEVQSGASRPDLVIKEIAIEIKGPTDSQALNTLASKLLRYEQYYTNTIIVLFECNFSEQLFKEIQNGIDRHFQNVKIIRK